MFDTSRRRMMGATLVGAGTLLSGLGLKARAETLSAKGRIMLDGFADRSAGSDRGDELPADRGDPRPALAPLREGRLDPRRAAGLHLAARPGADLRPRADDPAHHGRRQHRLAQPLRLQPELRAEDPELPGRGGRPDLPLVGRLPHQRDLLHRRQRHLLPADARHASGAHRPGDRPQGLARGAPVADRQALGRAAQHPAAGGAHGDAQHLVRERARQHAGHPGRRRRPAHDPDARLPRAERRLHLRRHQRPADPGHGPLRRPRRRRGTLSARPSSSSSR